ncbi:MAG: hypothetical protein RIC15_04070, partial [Vicingaceae bacterium]
MFLQFSAFASFAQPTVNMSFQGSVCMSEDLLIDNTTVNAVSYLWDFCQDGLEYAGSGSTVLDIGGFSSAEGLEVKHDKG